MPATDLVLHGGQVLTLDSRSTVGEAIAISSDRILAVGADAEILPMAGDRRVDLRGRTVIPGLIDAHAHLDREGLKGIYPSLAGATSIDDILQRIEALARDAEPGAWIVTMPIGEPPEYRDVPNNLRERRFPTRWELDRVSPRHPVYIRALWGYWRHALPLVSIANSEALRRAAVTAETLPPWAGIQIDKVWTTGEPNGIFVEWTYMPVVELSLMAGAPRFTHAQRVRALRDSMRIYNATGTTSAFEGHGIADEVRAVYREVAAAGEMTVRAHLTMSPSWSTAGKPPDEQVAAWASMLGGQGTGDRWHRVAGLFAESGITPDNLVRARAWPYTGWAGFAYDAGLPRDQLRDALIAAARGGVRVGGIQRDLLGLYEEVNRVAPIRDLRWVLEHISILTDDEIHRIRDLGLVVTTHTNSYIGKQGDVLSKRVGAGAEDTVVPLRKLLEAGVPVALATDNVPTSLWHPIAQTVTRRDRFAQRAIAPSQRLTRAEALRAATVGGAYLTFEEREKGTLEPGKLADLVVLSADPLTVDEARIADLVADVTIVGGRVVYESMGSRGASRVPRGAERGGLGGRPEPPM
jgi:predicted amidohydrolase YtcJ